MNQFRLVFSGILLPGVEREPCVLALAKMFNESPEVLDARLFGGESVVVKKTDDEQTARKMMKAFEKAGAVLKMEVDSPDEKTTRKRQKMERPDSFSAGASTAPTDPLPDEKTTRKRARMKPPSSAAPGARPPPADPAAGNDNVTRRRSDKDDKPKRRRRRRRPR